MEKTERIIQLEKRFAYLDAKKKSYYRVNKRAAKAKKQSKIKPLTPEEEVEMVKILKELHQFYHPKQSPSSLI